MSRCPVSSRPTDVLLSPFPHLLSAIHLHLQSNLLFYPRGHLTLRQGQPGQGYAPLVRGCLGADAVRDLSRGARLGPALYWPVQDSAGQRVIPTADPGIRHARRGLCRGRGAGGAEGEARVCEQWVVRLNVSDRCTAAGNSYLRHGRDGRSTRCCHPSCDAYVW